MKARTLAIARGTRRPDNTHTCGQTVLNEFRRLMNAHAKVLSDRNRSLLALIAESHPGSLAELSELSGRAKSNLSRTLKTMERYGLVQLRKGHGGTIIPRVPYSGIDLAVPLTL